jgi:hypothetical protein
MSAEQSLRYTGETMSRSDKISSKISFLFQTIGTYIRYICRWHSGLSILFYCIWHLRPGGLSGAWEPHHKDKGGQRLIHSERLRSNSAGPSSCLAKEDASHAPFSCPLLSSYSIMWIATWIAPVGQHVYCTNMVASHPPRFSSTNTPITPCATVQPSSPFARISSAL